MPTKVGWKEQLCDVADELGLPAAVPADEHARIIRVRVVHRTKRAPVSRALDDDLLVAMCRSSRCPTCYSPTKPLRIASVFICPDCGEEF